ncbi:MAG: hypothetical protein US95_C0001G0031 [Candidatus Woesebacteria bacterium GW2011_GWB1_38_5]|uniref:Uncharacterized protein n=3 Tax=Candidatus Woeseibacteriota TaxID=1752722 RepID=A0A0G0P5E4_9BACT|nr:MAG: hypothetical protein US67_C0003G0005 [Candidatus Woesebacteria bacterium GW2011_GWD1_38_10]KKQ75600.1 MAG: hypothetical protein US95_C0001G0031 [Candidatus Woesebacteria bacterium GW2011_GWB1_38_5]KKQ84546.1 MAG: hypothetical protein UT06_C0003G0019 [Candidatus Woesebacteria bacterium GW2011_GWA1_38_8]
MKCEFQKRSGRVVKTIHIKTTPPPQLTKEHPNTTATRNYNWRESHLQRERKPGQ